MGSTTFQNLHLKLVEDIKRAETYFSKANIELIYSSRNKLQGFDDCLSFFPSLFKFNRSCLVSLPSIEKCFHLKMEKILEDQEKQPEEEEFPREHTGSEVMREIDRIKEGTLEIDFGKLNEFKIMVES